MKKHLISFVLLLTVLSQCTVPELDVETNPGVSSDQKAAIEWYENYLRTADRSLRAAQTRPDWERIGKYRFSDGTPVLVAPLDALDGSILYSGTGGSTESSKVEAVHVREHLILFRDEDGIMKGWIARIVPSFGYQQKTADNLQSNTFEGLILVNDLNDKFLKGFVYENGKVIRESMGQSGSNARTEDCRPVHIDWWSVSCAPGGGCTWHYMYVETRLLCTWSSPSGAYSGEGGGSSGGSKWFTDSSTPVNIAQSEFLLQQITGMNFLTQNQTKQLEQALEDLLFKCLNRALYAQLVVLNKTFNFKIDGSINSPAIYNSGNGSLAFQYPNYIQQQYIQEELFHGYQDAYYPNGISQYSYYQGFANIEFEAKLFKDLVSTMEGGSGIFGVNASHPKSGEYNLWLQTELTNNLSSYPTSIDLEKYFYFLEAFKESNPAYFYPTRHDLFPNALMNLTQSMSCN